MQCKLIVAKYIADSSSEFQLKQLFHVFDKAFNVLAQKPIIRYEAICYVTAFCNLSIFKLRMQYCWKLRFFSAGRFLCDRIIFDFMKQVLKASCLGPEYYL